MHPVGPDAHYRALYHHKDRDGTGSLRDRLFLLDKEHVRLKDLDLFQACPHVVQIWPFLDLCR